MPEAVYKVSADGWLRGGDPTSRERSLVGVWVFMRTSVHTGILSNGVKGHGRFMHKFHNRIMP